MQFVAVTLRGWVGDQFYYGVVEAYTSKCDRRCHIGVLREHCRRISSVAREKDLGCYEFFEVYKFDSPSTYA